MPSPRCSTSTTRARPASGCPTSYGGNENLEAIDFLARINEVAYGEHPGVITIAEESTTWPGVSRPTYLGGLGFGLKWNMGWMNDTLRFMSKDPVYRRYHHHDLTFGLIYAFTENFILPLSHDEVVHGKGSLLDKMPGDLWQKFANLRAYYGFMWGHPGKKLLFMGGEFAQGREWNHDDSLDWHLLDDPLHRGVKDLVRDLNRALPRRRPSTSSTSSPAGFEWLEPTTGRTASSPARATARTRARSRSWSPTSRRCRATATASASRARPSTARSSTPTPSSTAARTSATWAA